MKSSQLSESGGVKRWLRHIRHCWNDIKITDVPREGKHADNALFAASKKQQLTSDLEVEVVEEEVVEVDSDVVDELAPWVPDTAASSFM